MATKNKSNIDKLGLVAEERREFLAFIGKTVETEMEDAFQRSADFTQKLAECSRREEPQRLRKAITERLGL